MTDPTAKPLTLKQANKAQAKRIADHLAKQATAAGISLPNATPEMLYVNTVSGRRLDVTLRFPD